jgi:Spy/CpxP family protein refolding chaperone
MKALTIATAALLVGMPLTAQQHDHQRHGHQPQHQTGMAGAHCMKMMGGAPPAVLLQHRDQLGLSADQVQRLEALRADAPGAGHMSGAMAAHRQAAELLQSERPDLAAYEAKLREASEHMIQAHSTMARSVVQARAILTPEQRQKAAEFHHGGMAHGQGHGMMGREGPRGMMGMMACPMMGAMHGAGEEHPGHPDH